jgi:hypothetical protein
MSIAQRLEDYWLSLRLANLDIPGLHLLRDRPLPTTSASSQTLHDALELYLRLKGVGKGTEEGRARISAANLRHGKFTKDKLEKRRENAAKGREIRKALLPTRVHSEGYLLPQSRQLMHLLYRFC